MSGTAPTRVGLIVPSSNVTVETEIPALLARHAGTRFSFHSSRMRMHQVSPEELRAMNAQRERCVDEIADAHVDALLYACLVAVMAQGPGEHQRTEDAIAAQLTAAAQPGSTARAPAVLSSAGALVEGLRAVGAERIVLVTPYLRPLAELVVGYLESEGFAVADWAALEVGDNTAVGCIPGDQVLGAARGLNLSGADALVISACVQMPSLDLIGPAEQEFGLPVLSAATAGAYALLRHLGLPAELPGAGRLLAKGAPAAAIQSRS
jgi:maleate isomerase